MVTPLLISLLCYLLALISPPLSVHAATVTVDWENVTFVSVTTPTLQAVMNPLILRQSPIHDAVWNNLALLNSRYTRLQTWFPFPKLSVVELQPPSGYSLCDDVSEFGTIRLTCDQSADAVIDNIIFASFGTPNGHCTKYSLSSCNALNTTAIIKAACVGKHSCAVDATTDLFGDPCYDTVKRLGVEVTCNPPQQNTYWNFTLQNEVVEDYMAATAGRPRVLDFSTQPNWLYNLSEYDSYPHYPDNPYEEDGSYQGWGTQLLDPTCNQLGEHFGRYAAYYTRGGFTDEYGRFIKSPYFYDIDHWELFNEMEHSLSIETYTCMYDAVVTNIRLMADPGHRIQFVGLANIQGRPLRDFSYFLNISNHRSNDIPLDWISYHFYSGPANRTDYTGYTVMFTDYDNFITNTILPVESIRKSLAPNVRTDLDEIGVIMPGDFDRPAPLPLPPIYWVAVASAYAYLYARVSAIGIEVLGASQLVGNPYLPDVMGGISPNYGSVSMVNWSTGAGTARFWGLKLMIDNFGPRDRLVNTIVNSDNSNDEPLSSLSSSEAAPATAVYAQAYVSESNQRRLLLINRYYTSQTVTIKASGGGIIWFIDESTGESPARSMVISNTTIILPPFAFAVILFPPNAAAKQKSSAAAI